MVTLKGDKEIGDKMNKIISKLAEANDLKGVIDVADFNDADKLGKAKKWWIDYPTWSPSSTTLPRLSQQPREAMIYSVMPTNTS